MIRQSTDPASAFVIIDCRPDGSVEFIDKAVNRRRYTVRRRSAARGLDSSGYHAAAGRLRRASAHRPEYEIARLRAVSRGGRADGPGRDQP